MKAKVRLLRRLADACDASTAGLEAWSEGSVVMSGGNMPEPDVFITRETPMTGPIRVETVALIVEIADTTADFDLGQKAALYAANNVAEYWVWTLKARQVHQLYARAQIPMPKAVAFRSESLSRPLPYRVFASPPKIFEP